MQPTATRFVTLTREGDHFRLAFPYNKAMVERVRNLPFAVYDDRTQSWLCLVCAQSFDLLNEMYLEGLLDRAPGDLLAAGETPQRVANAVLRAGSQRRPYVVHLARRDDPIAAKIKSLHGASYSKEARGWTFGPEAATALAELVTRGVLSDPDKLLTPDENVLTVGYDVRAGRFKVIHPDERAQKAFDKYFPNTDVVAGWRKKGHEVEFTDPLTEEIYRGELARAGEGIQPDDFRIELYPYQKQGVAMGLVRSGLLIADEPGLGKMQPVSEPVLTPDGWRPIGDLRPGDYVIGSDGKPTQVLGVFPQTDRRVVKVTFSDGTWTRVGWEHLWAVHTPNDVHRNPDRWRIHTTRELAEAGLRSGDKRRWRIPIVAPVEYPEADLPIDPYLLGCLLGDGGFTRHSPYFTTGDPEIIEELRGRLPKGVGIEQSSNGSIMYTLRGEGPQFATNPLTEALRELGLWGHRSETKFIPRIYLHASVKQRRDLLAGLLDTDGHIRGGDNNIEYSTSSAQLVQDVAELINSLGGVARIREKPTNRLVSYRISVQLPFDSPCPFKLRRKVDAWRPRSKYPPSRFIVDICEDGEEDQVCIKVAAPDQLYVTRHHIVTHNTSQAIGVGHLALKSREINRVVAVVPAHLRTQWADEIEKFTGDTSVTVIDGGPKERERLYRQAADTRWTIVHYEILHKDIDAVRDLTRGNMLVVDEAHRIRNASTKRSKAVRALGRVAVKRVALSATAVENSPDEWYWVLSGLAVPGCLGSFREFAERYMYKGRFGGYEGARNLPELARRSAVHFVRRRKKDVADFLPPLRVQHLPLDPDPAYAALLRRAHRDAKEELAAMESMRRSAVKQAESGEVDFDEALETTAGMTAVGMLRMLCSSPRILRRSDSPSAAALIDAGLVPDVDGPKVDELRVMAAEHQASGDRLVVFTSFKRMANLIAERFEEDGIRYVLITGDTSQRDRDDAVARFTDPDEPVTVFLATDAAAEGLNLGKTCSTLVNVDIPWTAGRLEQRANRIHRLDGTHPRYLVINMTLRGTIEGGILKRVENKADLADAILGDSDGRARTTGRVYSKQREVSWQEALRELDE